MTTDERADPRMVAAQLRKPSGEAAEGIGDKMDQVNEPLFDLTRSAMQPGPHERILEIGFGTGTYIPRLFAMVEELEVHGIDYSPEMVAQASRCNSTLIEAGRLKLLTGKSDQTPFPEAYFDKVFCNMVVYFWDRPEPHLAEIHRVLKPCGQFFIGMRTKDSMLEFPFAAHGFVLHEPEEWSAILEQNGFTCREAGRQLDPAIEIDNGTTQMESVCLAAGKREYSG